MTDDADEKVLEDADEYVWGMPPSDAYTPTDDQRVDVDDVFGADPTPPAESQIRHEDGITQRFEMAYDPDGLQTSFEAPHGFNGEPAAASVRPLTVETEQYDVYVTFTDEYIALHTEPVPPAGERLKWEITIHAPWRVEDTLDPDDEYTVLNPRDSGARGIETVVLAAEATDPADADWYPPDDGDSDTGQQFARWRDEAWWPLSGHAPGRLSLGELGQMNELYRTHAPDEPAPGMRDIYAATVVWLAQECDVSVAHAKGMSIQQLTSRLSSFGEYEAADYLLAAIRKSGDTTRDDEIDLTVAYHFTRFYADDYADSKQDADVHPDVARHENVVNVRDDDVPLTTDDPTDTTMPDFDITDHVETETVTEHTTTTADVPSQMDSDGTVVAEAEAEVVVEQEREVVAGGCQRDGCTAGADLPVEAAVPVVAGLTDDGHARSLQAWCPFCARSVYGDDVVDGDAIDALLPPLAAESDGAGAGADAETGEWSMAKMVEWALWGVLVVATVGIGLVGGHAMFTIWMVVWAVLLGWQTFVTG